MKRSLWTVYFYRSIGLARASNASAANSSVNAACDEDTSTQLDSDDDEQLYVPVNIPQAEVVDTQPLNLMENNQKAVQLFNEIDQMQHSLIPCASMIDPSLNFMIQSVHQQLGILTPSPEFKRSGKHRSYKTKNCGSKQSIESFEKAAAEKEQLEAQKEARWNQREQRKVLAETLKKMKKENPSRKTREWAEKR